MTNEEFQRIVLEELKGLRTDINGLKEGQEKLDGKVEKLEKGQQVIKEDLKAVINQTADLTEFREEINTKVDTLIEENDIIKEINGRHEVDIRRLKRKIV